MVFLAESAPRVPQIDDAYISYRYAQNLVDGHGLVFNPGERVEGFTNLLWTLLLAAGIASGLEAPAVAHALGLAAGVALLVATFALARVALPREHRHWAAAAPWLVLGATAFSRWSTSGLETSLFAAAGAAALAAEASGRTRLALTCLVTATLTRPEGALLAAIVLAVHVVERWSEGRVAWRAVGAYAAFLATLTAFRLAYYGSPVPNTFYAKVGGVPIRQGLDYAGSFLGDGIGFLLAPALVAGIACRRLRATAVYAAAVFVYVVVIGGDAFAHWRLLVPALPCLAALAVVGASRAWRQNVLGGAMAMLCLALAMVAQVAGVPSRWDAADSVKRWDEISVARGFDSWDEKMGHDRAERILRRGRASPLVASVGIGALGYYARVPILDLVGLVDPVIARRNPPDETLGIRRPGHQRSAADYVLGRRPEYILIQREGATPTLGNLVPAVHALWSHPDLERLYVWDSEVDGYRRRDEPVPAS